MNRFHSVLLFSAILIASIAAFPQKSSAQDTLPEPTLEASSLRESVMVEKIPDGLITIEEQRVTDALDTTEALLDEDATASLALQPHGLIDMHLQDEDAARIYPEPVIPDLAEVSTMDKPTLDLRDYTQRRIDRLLRDATLNTRIRDDALAERQYVYILTLQGTEEQRRNTYFALMEFYRQKDEDKKLNILYEKFVEEFPKHDIVPDIYLTLGRNYLDMGAYRTAQLRFYGVLNSALNIQPSEISLYQQRAVEAQIEIAYTHFFIGDYAQAERFFNRIDVSYLTPSQTEGVRFYSAYSNYLLERAQRALLQFKSFVRDFPQSYFAAQSYYLLARLHQDQNRIEDAFEIITYFLGLAPKKIKDLDESLQYRRNWTEWKRRSGNWLANKFYEVEDYSSAIMLYEAMLPAQQDIEWQLPIYYQLAMCYCKKNMLPKARKFYEYILANIPETGASSTLSHIKEMTQYQLQTIKWQEAEDTRLRAVIEMRILQQQTQDDSSTPQYEASDEGLSSDATPDLTAS